MKFPRGETAWKQQQPSLVSERASLKSVQAWCLEQGLARLWEERREPWHIPWHLPWPWVASIQFRSCKGYFMSCWREQVLSSVPNSNAFLNKGIYQSKGHLFACSLSCASCLPKSPHFQSSPHSSEHPKVNSTLLSPPSQLQSPSSPPMVSVSRLPPLYCSSHFWSLLQ